jgi:hypothetical protein
MEVAVHAGSKQHRAPRIRDDDSCASTNEQMRNKPDSRDDDMERGA